MQPEFEKLQPEFKAWVDSGLEKEQQELQQELQQESLYGRILGKFLKGSGSTQDVSKALGQKSISGALYVMMNKLREDGLIEWTIPEKPKSSKQKYKLTKKGLAFYLITRKMGRDQ